MRLDQLKADPDVYRRSDEAQFARMEKEKEFIAAEQAALIERAAQAVFEWYESSDFKRNESFQFHLEPSTIHVVGVTSKQKGRIEASQLMDGLPVKYTSNALTYNMKAMAEALDRVLTEYMPVHVEVSEQDSITLQVELGGPK